MLQSTNHPLSLTIGWTSPTADETVLETVGVTQHVRVALPVRGNGEGRYLRVRATE